MIEFMNLIVQSNLNIVNFVNMAIEVSGSGLYFKDKEIF